MHSSIITVPEIKGDNTAAGYRPLSIFGNTTGSHIYNIYCREKKHLEIMTESHKVKLSNGLISANYSDFLFQLLVCDRRKHYLPN